MNMAPFSPIFYLVYLHYIFIKIYLKILKTRSMIISQSLFFKAFFLFKIITYNLTVVLATPHYFGNIFYFLILCILINCLLYYSFLKSQYFFNIFFSIFILLGFGFKFTLSLIFLNKDFSYNFSNPFYSEGGMLRILSQKLLEQNSCVEKSMNSFRSIKKPYIKCYVLILRKLF